MRRARLLSVVTALVAGAMGIVSSTQTWLDVTVSGGVADSLTVSGAAAVPVLAPLSLATLALGLALSIVGRMLRYVFGALMVVIAAVLGILTGVIAFGYPVSAAGGTVTAATGIAGDAVGALVDAIVPTPWPFVALGAWVVLCVAGAVTLATAHTWRGTGRRFRTGSSAPVRDDAAPLDAVDSWDDLTRGDDPTASARAR